MPAATRKPFKKHPLTLAVKACCTLLGAVPLAHAGPSGGQVVGGSGTISQSGASTTIHQTSHRMAINWQSYNLAVDERVQYVQPDASALSLNRILSNDGSTIAGRIDANGRVILVNPNGIFFTSSASLNVGSLIASGLDINPADFMSGQYVFSEIPGTSGAVVNGGMINASLGGNVALIGRRAENNGLIAANLGTVTLTAGKEAVLTFDDAGVLGVRVSREILQNELGVDPAVLNSGEIAARGGRVLLTASQSQDVFSRAVNTGGLDPATSVVVNDDGTFTLGSGADVLNSGTIDTSTISNDPNVGRIVLIGENVTSSGTLRADALSGNGGEIELHARDMTLLTQESLTSARSEADGRGGIVKVLGDKVGLFDQATVDVSGANGGGQVLIGGDFQGRNSYIRSASATIVHSGASVYVDALANGDGGKAIVWSNGTTYFAGSIFARGGQVSGNGGLVETSGKADLVFTGSTDRSAVNGQAGLLLLDPHDITVGTSGDLEDENELDNGGVSFNECSDPNCSATTDNFSISAATLQSELSNGDVRLQANNDIKFDAAVSSTSDRNLILQAGRSISINASISLNGGDFSAVINHQDAALAGRDAGSAEFTMADNTAITTLGGAISITTGSFAESNASIGNITLRTLNSSAPADVVGQRVAGGGITVTNSAGDIVAHAAISATGEDPANIDGGHGGNIQITADAGTFTLEASGSITSNGGNAGIGQDGNNNGGNGGTVELAANNISLFGAVTSNGGNGAGSGTRGNGGSITATVGGNLTVDANISSFGLTNGAIAFNGSSGDNVFNINNDITLTGSSVTVDSLGGNDRLVRGGTTVINSTWTITGINEGTLQFNGNTIDFLSTESLIGGAAQDGFVINSPGSLSGLLDGGGDASDTLAINTVGTGIQLGNRTDAQAVSDTNLNVVGIETITANATSVATNIILGDNAATTWAVNGANGGSVAPTAGANAENTTAFSNFAVLTGGTNVDSFEISAAFAGTISGGNGADVFNVAASAVIESNGAVNGDAGNDAFNIAGAVAGALNGGEGDDAFTLMNTGVVSGTIDGGANTAIGDTLVARQGVVNLWGFTSTTDGSLTQDGELSPYVNAFTDIENFTGGGTDSEWANFSGLGASVSIDAGRFAGFAGVIGGGGTLNGTDGGDAWTVQVLPNADGVNDGTIEFGGSTLRFIDFANLGGGAGDDTFTITDTGSITGEIDGGGGSNRLVGRDSATTWTLIANTENTGNVGVTNGTKYVARFSNIQNLAGGTGGDTFVYEDGASITGTVGGGDGHDVVDKSLVSGAVDIALGSSAYIDIEEYIGNNTNSTLTGLNGPNAWFLDGENDGGVNGILFTNFNNLVGGSLTDTFTFSESGSLTGSLNGGDGTDSIDMSASLSANITLGPSGVSNVETLTGNDSGTLTGSDSTNLWTLMGDNDGEYDDGSGNVVTFVNFSNLAGGTGDDTFVYTDMDGLTGTLSGGGGSDTVDMSGLGTVIVNLGASGVIGIEEYIGNNTDSTLIGVYSDVNEWSIDGQNSGDVNGIYFVNFNNLVGGSLTDTFTFSGSGSLMGSLNGGGGIDSVDMSGLTTASVILGPTGVSYVEYIYGNGSASTLTGANTTNAWSLTDANEGTVNGIYFYDFANLVGGSGQDTFTFLANGSLSGSLNGGDGVNDAIDKSGVTGTVSVTLGPTGVSNVEIITGNGSNSTLIAENTTNAWTISGDSDGRVNGIFFYDFDTLVGGSVVDTFTMAGGIIGSIDMGAGSDSFTMTGGTAGSVYGNTGNDSFTVSEGYVATLDGGADSDSFAVAEGLAGTIDGGSGNDYIVYTGQNVTVDVGQGLNGFEGVRAQEGTGTLNGQNLPSTWAIYGANTGSVTDSTGTLEFVGFSTLNGGDASDVFNVTGAGSVSGVIDGKGGSDALNVLIAGQGSGVNFIGGTGNDSVTVSNAVGNTATYATASYIPGQGSYDQIVSGNGFVTNYQLGEAGDVVNFGVSTVTLTINGSGAGDTITLGSNMFQVGAYTPVHYSNVTNITVNGQGGSDVVNLNSLNLAGGTLSLTGESVAGNSLTAGTLVLNNVGQFGSAGGLVSTSLDTLWLVNTGSVYLSESGDLSLNTTGTVNNAGIFRIAGTTRIDAGGGSLTLDNASNDFDVVNVANAASVSLRDMDRIDGGSVTAGSVTLNTVSGIGTSAADLSGSPSLAFTTNTASLTVNNSSSGGVYIRNSGATTVNIVNSGDIGFANSGNLVVDRLYTGGTQFSSRSGFGSVYLSVDGGSVRGTSRSIYVAPDITATDLTVIVGGTGGFGTSARPMSISVTDTFTYIGAYGYVYYFGDVPPTDVFGVEDLVSFKALDSLTSLRLLEVESLEEFDPAIFTDVRNYYYEDVAILMPADQRLDGPDEEEKLEETKL